MHGHQDWKEVDQSRVAESIEDQNTPRLGKAKQSGLDQDMVKENSGLKRGETEQLSLEQKRLNLIGAVWSRSMCWESETCSPAI